MASGLPYVVVGLVTVAGVGTFVLTQDSGELSRAAKSAPGYARMKALIDAKDRSNPTPGLVLAKRPPERADRVVRSEADWAGRLGPHRDRIMRHQETELAFSSPLVDEHRPGLFVCGACGSPLFSADAKFDSRTGWPSFVAPAQADAVWYRLDHAGGLLRTEVRCARCDGHLGHVFADGPRERGGLRYCINGDAMAFIPQAN